jgi:PDZ domain-containing protein
MRFLSPARAAATILVLAAVALVVLYVVPSNHYYVFVPDTPHSLAPLVRVNAKSTQNPGGGAVYFVDVRFRKARLLEDLLKRPLSRGASLEPAADVLGGASEQQQQKIDANEMDQSQQIAKALVLKRLGYDVKVTLPTVVIGQVEPGTPAAKVLRAKDRLLALNGVPLHSIGRLRQLLDGVEPGSRVTVRYARARRARSVSLRTVRDPTDASRSVIGVIVGEAGGRVGKLPVKIKIDTGNVGGPSAGLAFALELMEALGHNVDRGYDVAATGELELDGTVLPIGGVKQKTIGVESRSTHVDMFLVPAGSNAQEARRYAKGLEVVPVKSFAQALSDLAKLPPKARMNG